MTTSAAPAPQLARGVLAAAAPDRITFGIPGTDYQLHLAVRGPLGTHAGKRLVGTIRVQARRADVVKTGGRFIEPVMGRPRRIQGEVAAVDPTARAIIVRSVVPVVAALDAHQSPDMFRIGDLVAFDAAPGAAFEPA